MTPNFPGSLRPPLQPAAAMTAAHARTAPAVVYRAEDAGVVVPRVLRVTAALGWRSLVVVAALYVLGQAASYVAAVVIPMAVALLLAALLSPAVHRLQTG